MNVLELWPFAAIRRNHALEHATIHVLSARHLHVPVAGRSDWSGFTLYGPLATKDVATAVSEALARLRAGECHLAVHPRCGTNLATGVVLVGITSYATLRGQSRSRLEKALQWIVTLAAGALLARPLGVRVQQNVTTASNVGGLRVVRIRRSERGSLVVHRIETG